MTLTQFHGAWKPETQRRNTLTPLWYEMLPGLVILQNRAMVIMRQYVLFLPSKYRDAAKCYLLDVKSYITRQTA